MLTREELNTPPNIDHVAKQHLTALIEDITEWQEQISNRPNWAELPMTMAVFCDEAYLYAKKKFDRLEPNKKGRGLFLRNMTELLQMEWMIAREAIQQHQGPQKDILKALDEWAQKLYDHCRHIFNNETDIIPAAKFMTYLDELVSLTRIGIPGYGFIAVPVFALKSPFWEIQGIPHEIGHYLLESVEGLIGELREVLVKCFNELGNSLSPRVARIWDKWLNEVVSDIVGTLLGGPRFADGIQQKLVGLDEYMFVSDGRHPVPILRPLIHTTVLNLMDTKKTNWGFGEQAQQLKTRWLKAHDNQDYSKKWYQENSIGAVELIHINDLEVVLDTVVTKLCQTNLSSLGNKSLLDLLPDVDNWSTDDQSSNLKDQIEQNWAKDVESISVEPLAYTTDQMQQIDEALDSFLQTPNSILPEQDVVRNNVLQPLINKKNKLELVALPEDRKILAPLLNNIDSQALKAWAIYNDLKQIESLLEEQRLTLANNSHSLVSLKYTPKQALQDLLPNIDEETINVIKQEALSKQTQIISLDITYENFVAHREVSHGFILILGLMAAAAGKLIIG